MINIKDKIIDKININRDENRPYKELLNHLLVPLLKDHP